MSVHLLKVALQPTFVVVDENGAREVLGAPVEIPGPDWPSFATQAFGDTDLAKVAEEYATQAADPATA